ncbi:MAG: thioesterase family protein [Pseudomonadota bacterium]
MNLWLRLLWLLATARFQVRLAEPTETVALGMRVWPGDLDISLHMNNGRYLTIMDLGRLAFLFRSTLWDVVRREKLTPMVAAIAIRYRRELRPFQRYTLTTQIIGWRDTTVLFEQKFVARGGSRDGQVAARALVRAGLYNRAKRRWETVADLMAATGVGGRESPKLPADAEAFLATETEMQGIDRRRISVVAPTDDRASERASDEAL